MPLRFARRTSFPSLFTRSAAIAAIACTGISCATTPSGPQMHESCREWTDKTDEERFAVVGAALDRQVGGPTSSNLVSCLWLVSEQIADQSAAICEREGGDFDRAMGRALESAVAYCEER